MMPFHLRGFAGSKPAARTKQILLMPETRPSKEFQVNYQGRKNNYKDNASELASSHPKRGALSLSGSYLGIQLDICACSTCVPAISAAIVFTSSVEPGRFAV
jgi:hypothetical protein